MSGVGRDHSADSGAAIHSIDNYLIDLLVVIRYGNYYYPGMVDIIL